METGISDHHLLIFPFFESLFHKNNTKLRYRKYKSFSKIEFLKDDSNLPEKTNYAEWENQLLRILNKHAPLKSKVIRGNNKFFATKTLRKSIMQKSTLKKKTNNLNDPLAIKLYKKQMNYAVNLS